MPKNFKNNNKKIVRPDKLDLPKNFVISAENQPKFVNHQSSRRLDDSDIDWSDLSNCSSSYSYSYNSIEIESEYIEKSHQNTVISEKNGSKLQNLQNLPNILKPLEKSKSEILPNEADKSKKSLMMQGIEVAANTVNNCSGDNMENSQPNNNLSVKKSNSITQKRESGNSKHKILRADFEVIW